MKMTRFFSLILLCAAAVFAAAVPPKPATGAVYDDAKLLTQDELQKFNAISTALYKQTGFALTACLMYDIGDEEARDYALRVTEAWGIGKAKTDEAALIFVAMKQKRRSVEVGYGAEAYLPDALVERLQQSTLVPAFRRDEYGAGILSLEYAIAQSVAKEKGVTLNVQAPVQAQERKTTDATWPFIIIIVIILILLFRKNRKDRNGGFRGGPGPFIGGIGGGFGGGFGGYGHSSGFGGGFGGFGGGHFGGGGSGGSW